MSTRLKLVIPFIDKNITPKDFSIISGFIDAYRFDVNRPSIQDCIFLMYDNSIRTKESADRYFRFKDMQSLQNIKTYRINGKSYTVYAFKITNPTLLSCLNNFCNVLKYSRVLQFWGVSDGKFVDDITKGLEDIPEDISSVPECDYLPDLINVIKTHKLRVTTHNRVATLFFVGNFKSLNLKYAFLF